MIDAHIVDVSSIKKILSNCTYYDLIIDYEFNYNDKVNFTNSVGLLKSITDEKSAVINDYEPEYAKEFVELVKKQINNVYINQGASIGINLEPIFN